MFIIKGKSVYGGVAIGKISVYNKKSHTIKRYHIDDISSEITRFNKALQEGISDLDRLYEEAKKQVGEANAAIFGIHKMMIEDVDYNDSIKNIIKNESVNAEYAIGVTCENFSEMFSSMDDAYMRERAADVKDVSDRLLNILSGNSR